MLTKEIRKQQKKCDVVFKSKFEMNNIIQVYNTKSNSIDSSIITKSNSYYFDFEDGINVSKKIVKIIRIIKCAKTQ